jgi:hypothetical protein
VWGSPATYSSPLASALPASRRGTSVPAFYEYRGLYRGTRALEKLVHRPGGVLAHILEDVGVPSEGHRRVGVAEHPGDRVERNALPQGQSAGGVTQVVEADVCRETRLLEVVPEGAHHGVAPTDLAFRVRGSFR